MIAINAKPAFHHPRTGVEEYSFQLLKHLALEIRKREVQDYVRFYIPRPRSYGQDFPSISFKILGWQYLWTQGRLSLQLLYDRPDIFFNPEQILPRFAPERSVVAVHDVAYEIYPQFYPSWHRRYLRMVTSRAVKKAKRIIAVSERTKRDIGIYYGIPQRKIEVIHHGFLIEKDFPNERTSGEINPLTLPTKLPYLLFLGRIELKKNILTLIEAFERIVKKFNPGYALLLAGSKGFGYELILRKVKASDAKDHIFFLGYVDKHTKSTLYRNASVFVFPSLYEGFGLPVLEAQSFGIPVVSSNTSSLPEVVGKGGFLVNPLDPDQIALKIIEALTSKKMRHYLIKKGYENLTRFSWEKTAKQTLDLLLTL